MVPACAVDIKSSQLQKTMFVDHVNAKMSKALTGVGVQRPIIHIAHSVTEPHIKNAS